MRRIKTVGAAGALLGSALIGGTLISSVLAAPAPTTTPDTTTANLGVSDAYLDTYLDTLASELGVDRAALGPAALAAAKAAIDAAVTAGDIDADRAAELKSELEALDNPASILAGRGMFGMGRGGPGGRGFGVGSGNAADAAATALGLDVSDLLDRMRSGSTLEEVASTQKVDYASVVAAVTDAVKADLDTAVADGRITQDQADELLTELQTWLDGGGQPDEGGFGHGFGHEFGRHGPNDDSSGTTDSAS